jgi:hypothetical protein
VLNRQFSTFFAILLLLAFVGQTVASTRFHCQMAQANAVGQADESWPSAMDHAAMGHAKMGHAEHQLNGQNTSLDDSPSSPANSSDCCQLSGNCSLGNCSATPILSQLPPIMWVTFSHSIPQLLPQQTSQPASRLYRPPIIA